MSSSWDEIFSHLLSEDQWEEFLTIAIDHLSFSDNANMRFKLRFESACISCGLKFKKYKDNLISSWKRGKNSKKRNKGARKPKVNLTDDTFVSWYNLSPPDLSVTYTMKTSEAKAVLEYILRSPWITEVTSISEIPSNISKAFSCQGVQINSVFNKVSDHDNLQSTMKPHVHRVLSISRMLYSLERMSLSGDEQDNTTNDRPTKRQKVNNTVSDYAHYGEEREGDNDNEEEEEDVLSNMGAYITDKTQSLTLLPSDATTSIIATTNTFTPTKTLHPYSVSIFLFCVAKRLSETIHLPELQLYEEIVDHMSNVNRANRTIPEDVIAETKSTFASYLSGTNVDNPNYKLLSLLEHTSELMTRQRRLIVNVCKSKGKFTSILSRQQRDSKYVALTFDRKTVSPLDVMTAMKMLRLRYMRWLDDKDISIEFDDTLTRLILPSYADYEIRERINYQLCVNHNFMTRTQYPCPIFPFVVRSFATFDRDDVESKKRLLASMKIMIKWFDISRVDQSRGWPDPEKDDLASYFMILPLIMNRFKTKDKIDHELKSPLLDEVLLRFKVNNSTTTVNKPVVIKLEDCPQVKRRRTKTLMGFRDGATNIYTAIKSLCYMRFKHRILSRTVIKLKELFLMNHKLQTIYPIQYKIIDYMYQKIEETDDAIVDIPFLPFHMTRKPKKKNNKKRKDREENNEFYDVDADEEEEEEEREEVELWNEELASEDKQSIPCHVSLYYLCCDSDLIPDDIAINIFLDTTYIDNGFARLTLSSPHPNLANMSDVRLKCDNTFDSMRRCGKIDPYLNLLKEMAEPYNGIRILAESLEQLSYYPIRIDTTDKDYRGNVTLLDSWHGASQEEICNANVRCIPLQFDDNYDPQFADQVFPMWSSELYDRDTVPKRTMMQDEMDLLPFTGCHKDLLESVTTHPCTLLYV